MLLLDYLAASPAALILVCVLFGLLVGSFLNVVIHRIPKMMEATWRQEARELLEQPLHQHPIATRDHCFACTAGQGSSCGGTLN